MKRLAVLTLTAALAWGGTTGRAADPLPLPTGFAPTAPRVPAPTVKGGVVTPAAATTGPAAGAVQVVGFGARPREMASDWTRDVKVWCSDCAPAVRHPLPPLPETSGCAGGDCGVCGHDGNCWSKFKNWLCFRYTPVHLGLTPTPRIVPPYTYFPCTERAGCADGNCGPGGCGVGGLGHPGHPRLGGGLFGNRGCTTCPQPGEAVMPGFRFAAPTTGTPTTTPASVAAPAGEVVPSGFRLPPHPQSAPARTTPSR